MELLDIVDENGNPTGETVERETAHRQGIRHRTSHVWIVRKKEGITEESASDTESAWQILLQKRSRDKDSHPGCYDISSAGHIPAGSGFLDSAIRELFEELGVVAEESELRYCGTRKLCWEETFYGKLFRDNQVSNVYLLERDLKEEEFHIQESEIESVMWMDFEECVRAVREGSIPNCIVMEELEMVRATLVKRKAS